MFDSVLLYLSLFHLFPVDQLPKTVTVAFWSSLDAVIDSTYMVTRVRETDVNFLRHMRNLNPRMTGIPTDFY